MSEKPNSKTFFLQPPLGKGKGYQQFISEGFRALSNSTGNDSCGFSISLQKLLIFRELINFHFLKQFSGKHEWQGTFNSLASWLNRHTSFKVSVYQDSWARFKLVQRTTLDFQFCIWLHLQSPTTQFRTQLRYCLENKCWVLGASSFKSD